MSSKRQASKKPRPVLSQATAASDSPVAAALKQCEVTQGRLNKHAQESDRLQAQRKDALKKAFQAGATTYQLSAALGVSRTKVYQLLGPVR